MFGPNILKDIIQTLFASIAESTDTATEMQGFATSEAKESSKFVDWRWDKNPKAYLERLAQLHAFKRESELRERVADEYLSSSDDENSFISMQTQKLTTQERRTLQESRDAEIAARMQEEYLNKHNTPHTSSGLHINPIVIDEQAVEKINQEEKALLEKKDAELAATLQEEYDKEDSENLAFAEFEAGGFESDQDQATQLERDEDLAARLQVESMIEAGLLEQPLQSDDNLSSDNYIPSDYNDDNFSSDYDGMYNPKYASSESDHSTMEESDSEM